MSEILYYAFVFPIESILKTIFVFLKDLLGSDGLSIIVLSLLVNSFLLKLFFLADRVARKHAIVKRALDLKLKEFKRVFKGIELYVYTKTLFRQNGYHPIYALKALGGLALQVPFFIAVVFLFEFHSPGLQGLGFWIIRDLSKPDGILWGVNLLPLLMTLFTLINVWVSSKEKNARIQGGLIALIFLFLLYRMPSSLLLYWTISMFFAMSKSIIASNILQRTKAEDVATARVENQKNKEYKKICIWAILSICLMVFFYNPTAIYASDVSQLNPENAKKVLAALFGFFLVSIFLINYIAGFFYQTKFFKVVTYGFCVAFVIGIIYNFILDYNVVTGENYGQIDNFAFKDSNVISGFLNRYVDLAVGIFSCIFIFFLIRMSKKFIIVFLCVFFISFLSFSFINSAKIYIQAQKIVIKDLKLTQADDKLPSYSDELLTLSKNKKNILIVLSDGFSGSHLEFIFRQFPELQKNFEGFTYYPNALSLDGHTSLTAHTILTGHKTSALNNKDKSLKAFNEYIQDQLVSVLVQFSQKYQVDIYNLPHITEGNPILQHKGIGNYRSRSDYFPYFLNKHQEFFKSLKDFQMNALPIGELISIGFFNFAPYTLRTRIYSLGDHGSTWIFGNEVTIDTFLNGAVNASELESMVSNFKVSNTKKPTFKYIHTMATHWPFVLDANCKLSFYDKMEVPEEYSKFVGNSSHYGSEVCAVRNFVALLDFLKRNKIYDNTMLIFVSDHSYNDVYPSQYSLGNQPNPLILIKNFDSKDDFRVDRRLMSNADIAGIICDIGLGGCNGIEENILKNYPKTRTLINTLNIHWSESARRADHLIFQKIFQVEDNLFDPKKWTDITKQSR